MIVSYIDFDAVHKRMIEADLIEDWLDRNFGFEQSFGTERKYQNYLQRNLIIMEDYLIRIYYFLLRLMTPAQENILWIL